MRHRSTSSSSSSLGRTFPADILVDVTNPGMWMAHCHIAGQMHAGMMFNFHVAPTPDAE